jgi:ATP-dependent Clp protease ATP-binding subunit ClpX
VPKDILLNSLDSPYTRSKAYFEVMDIELEIDEVAASMIAEAAQLNIRTGARALRTVFNKIINALEYDPWEHEGLEKTGDGHRLQITQEMAKRAISGNGG